MKIIDVNVLLYIVNPDAEQHLAVRKWWEAVAASGQPLGFSWLVIIGFIRISTNRRAFYDPLTVQEALAYMDEWLALPNARIVQEANDHWQVVRDLLATVGTAGNLTSDAHLAALAMSHHAAVASCDADFLRFRQIRWENPLAALPT